VIDSCITSDRGQPTTRARCVVGPTTAREANLAATSQSATAIDAANIRRKKALIPLTTKVWSNYHFPMLDIQVSNDPGRRRWPFGAHAESTPLRLAVPSSAATLALGLAWLCNKVNYHLRSLEAHGLGGRLARNASWGGLKRNELARATAASYVVRLSPWARSPVAPRSGSRSGGPRAISSPCAGAGRREVGDLVRPRESGHTPGHHLSVATEVRFRSHGPGGFSNELTEGHHETRFEIITMNPPRAASQHRLVVGAHPLPQKILS